MDRKFNPGDLVYETSDPSKKLYIVQCYEPVHGASVLRAFDNTPIPESEYEVTCYWVSGEERIYKQFEESQLTKSSNG